MTTLNGISASPGISFGTAYLYVDEAHKIPHYSIEADQAAAEFERFKEAVRLATAEIERMKADGRRQPDELAMLDTHLMMLLDPDLEEQVEKRLASTLQNAEWVVSIYIQEMVTKLGAAKDEYLRERTSDFTDIGKRLINYLTNASRKSLVSLDEDIILVCRDLMPSDAITMDKRRVKAIAMDVGGKTSHTAILARAFEIPAVLGLGELTAKVKTGDTVIVDGIKGQVIIQPDAATLASYASAQKAQHKREVQLMRLMELPAETRDGKLILLKGNIEIPEETDAVLAHGADGIGLYRSEFLFLKAARLPDEEEQFAAYSRVLKAMGDKPVTIRTLDIGGDKLLKNMKNPQGEYYPGYNEKNPIVGWRAIRFCLSHEDLFKTQLRALYRASVYGNLRIMLPLISGMQEVNDTLVIIEEVKSELKKKKLGFRDNVPVGIMIEVPSAAMTSDILAKRSAFFSIGTNDLIQYTIAVDRGNENIAYLYKPLHPGVLRMLKLVIENAHRAGISVAMCGEMAGDPLYSLVLLGLGLDEFSMSSIGIPEVKEVIRRASVSDAEEFVGRILEMSSTSEIDAYVRSYMEERFGITNN
jgi:phosphotransferase system enzyme I (PtsI)